MRLHLAPASNPSITLPASTQANTYTVRADLRGDEQSIAAEHIRASVRRCKRIASPGLVSAQSASRSSTATGPDARQQFHLPPARASSGVTTEGTEAIPEMALLSLVPGDTRLTARRWLAPLASPEKTNQVAEYSHADRIADLRLHTYGESQ